MSFLLNAAPNDPNRRMDFWFAFTVEKANPNGDPDAGGKPRVLPEDNRGWVSEQCLHRKMRNAGARFFDWDLYYSRGESDEVLDDKLIRAYQALKLRTGKKKGKGEKGEDERSPLDRATTKKVQAYMCGQYPDIALFGAVLASKMANGGQLRGPLRLSSAWSVNPVEVIENSLTRQQVQTHADLERNRGANQTMGSKWMVRFGLYEGTGGYDAVFGKQNGVTPKLLSETFESIARMFECDASSSRPSGSIAMRRIFVFVHDSPLGSAPVHKLFDAIRGRSETGKPFIGLRREGELPSHWDDYTVPILEEVESRVAAAGIQGVRVIQLV